MAPRCNAAGVTIVTDNVYLSEQEFSERFHIGRRTLQRWRITGDGPAFVRFGPRHVKYRLADIESWTSTRTFAHRAEEIAA
jgi:hypothetical protein